ncbi:glycosyltransferase family 4 protein [Patescibacteria group bacterium]|nr:glycosyltransferase family 4 protein [Patescibacteria group bacterium]MBU1473189.1 glycosyltransferase family 4 protein [Patescibacteria group bacterium]MBU2459761.1 glycosyltransferase family 4 protein [Patescibacteria group bacterium]MBU2544273.1 glycosyltransferase family 4 protein [Patescibacteria group bacterium]
MKILFVSAVLPYPPFSGGQIRLYNLLKRLSREHEITLYSFIRDNKERSYLKSLRFCKRVEVVMRGRAWQPKYVAGAAFGKYPFLLSTYQNSFMRLSLGKELEENNFDIVHAEPFYVWPSIPYSDKPLVVGEHNIEYRVYTEYVRHFPIVPLRPILYADVLKMRFWEEHSWGKASHLVTVSQEDKQTILKAVPDAGVTVVVNGVDESLFGVHTRKLKKPPEFLFLGDFRWMPNTDALRHLLSDLWPQIRERYPGASLRVVGQGLSFRYVQEIEKHHALSVGEVSDIAGEYRRADVLLAPMRIPGGTKFKILEAFAAGIPVVTTLNGVFGLDVRHRVHAWIAQTDEEYVEGVRVILTDQAFRMQLVQNSRKLVESRYNWDTIAKTLDRVWRESYGKKS